MRFSKALIIAGLLFAAHKPGARRLLAGCNGSADDEEATLVAEGSVQQVDVPNLGKADFSLDGSHTASVRFSPERRPKSICQTQPHDLETCDSDDALASDQTNQPDCPVRDQKQRHLWNFPRE